MLDVDILAKALMLKNILKISFFCFFMAGSAAAWESHWVGREGAMRHHISIVGAEAVWIVGDSIIEGFWWNQIGGCRIVNVGLGGITARQMAERIVGLSGYATPRYAIIMIGTNTANYAVPQAEVEDFATHVLHIVDALVARGARPLLATIPPIEHDVGVAALFSQSRVNHMNMVLTQIASERGYPLIDLNSEWLDEQQLSARHGTTTDGVHLSSMSYLTLFDAFNESLASAVLQDDVPCV